MLYPVERWAGLPRNVVSKALVGVQDGMDSVGLGGEDERDTPSN